MAKVNRYRQRFKTVEERFWEKVQKTETCWLWIGQVRPDGYGHFWDGSRKVSAHRFAYELLVGPIPEGLEPDHLCRVTRCVRPTHLEPVTHRENMRRGDGWSGLNARKTHCAKGHPYDEANTYYRREGHRECRACHRRREAERWRRLHPA